MKLLRFKGVKIFIFILIFLVLPIGLYLYNILSEYSVQLDASAFPDRIMVGETFDIKVSIRNDSKDSLNNVQLTFNIPDGVVLANGGASNISRVRVGEIGSEEDREEIVKFIALPIEPNSIMDETATIGRKLGVQMFYEIDGLTASFKREESVAIQVENLPLQLDVKAPDQILAGQEFEILANYKSLGAGVAPDFKASIDYPSVFTKTDSSPKADFTENSWLISGLQSGEEKTISLKGSADLPDNSELSMTVKAVIKILDKEYLILSRGIRIPIAPSPLSLKIYINDDKANAYRPGDLLNYTLIYKNNSDVSLANISIKVKLTGQMYDFSSLNSNNASFNFLNKTLTWNSTTLPGLQTLEPSSSGSVAFSINLLGNYPIKRLNDKNFMIKADARIESPTVPRLVSASKTINSAVLESKIAGNIFLESKALYRDADSFILNSGSLPPKVGEAIDFTIHLFLTNYSTDMMNVEARARAEDGVVFTGVVKSNGVELPTIDSESGEIVWRLAKLYATTGITGDKPEAIFQVRVTPTDKYVGNYMPILGEIRLTAKDDFTGSDFMATFPSLTTQLSLDPSIKDGEGKVVR